MKPAELRNKQIELSRALRAGRDAEAERLATELAPYFEALCNELDRDPKAAVPSWGVEA